MPVARYFLLVGGALLLLLLVTGVWLVVMGVVQIVQAFQIRKDAKTALYELMLRPQRAEVG